jgi:hypothetical protein
MRVLPRLLPCLLCLCAVALLAVTAAAVDADFRRFRAGMLETTKLNLEIEKKYRDCLAEAADREDYFFCRDMRDQALHLETAARVGERLNPDASFVWDDTTWAMYLKMTDQAISGRKDTIFCLEHSESMEGYEQCLLSRRADRQQ